VKTGHSERMKKIHLDGFKINGLRKILQVSWTAHETNEWVLNNATVKRELLDTVKGRKLSYHGLTMRKQSLSTKPAESFSALLSQKRQERDNARNNVRCTQAKKTTHVLDGQRQYMNRTPVEESVRMTEDRDKWRKYVHGVANPWIEGG